MNTDMIRAVLFDLDGTLRNNQPSWNDTINDYLAGVDPRLDAPDARREALRWDHSYWAQSPELLADVPLFENDDNAFWTNYYRRRLLACGFPAARAEALAAELKGHLDENFHPREHVADDIRPTLAALREAGLVLGLVSNRMRSVEVLLAELDLRRFLHFSLISGEVHSWKPEAAIFAHALDRSGTRPAETVYVGDNYYADVVGARRAGLQPVLIDPRGLFPEADCPVIATMGELLPLLGLKK